LLFDFLVLDAHLGSRGEDKVVLFDLGEGSRFAEYFDVLIRSVYLSPFVVSVCQFCHIFLGKCRVEAGGSGEFRVLRILAD
jgi:hypothetical protein